MAERVLTVSQLNMFIKRLLESSAPLKKVALEGEITNMRFAASGHLYFNLSDEFSQISCIMWRSDTGSLTFMPEEGMFVKIRGSVRVYEKGGTYQVTVKKIERAGVGTMYLEMERVKREIERLGWTSPEQKKPVPQDVTTVGVVTSAQGAAIHDIITTLNRRNPTMNVLLAPALVQGEQAPEDIARAVRALDREDIDVMIVGRGGGSAEDLQAFNTLPVLRAIHEAKTPVVSAVGHETDVLLSDLVADLRAPTPTGAAELVSEDYETLADELLGYRRRITRTITDRIRSYEMALDLAGERLAYASPALKLQRAQERRAQLAYAMTRSMEMKISRDQKRRIPESALLQPVKLKLVRAGGRLNALRSALEALSPLRMLDKGYALVTDGAGRPVTTRAEALRLGQIDIHFKDGAVRARIDEEQHG